MGAVTSFDVLGDRLLFRGRLRLETGLSIGTGTTSLSPLAHDNPVVRDSAGVPIIPGSSVKGVLRSYLERLANAGWLGEGIPSDACLHNRNRIDELKAAHADAPDALAAAIWEQLCPVCRLFGCQHFAGRFYVPDLYLDWNTVGWWSPDRGREMPLELRTGVSIDRDSGTKQDNRLFDREVVPAGVSFHFRAVVENPAPGQGMTILFAIAALMRGDLSLGGSVTRGLGHVRLLDAEVRRITPTAPNEFLAYLFSTADPFADSQGWQRLSGEWESDCKLLADPQPLAVSREQLRRVIDALPDGSISLYEVLQRVREEARTRV